MTEDQLKDISHRYREYPDVRALVMEIRYLQRVIRGDSHDLRRYRELNSQANSEEKEKA